MRNNKVFNFTRAFTAGIAALGFSKVCDQGANYHRWQGYLIYFLIFSLVYFGMTYAKSKMSSE